MTAGLVGPIRLRVAELFGPTLQGEGLSVGQQALFVRMSGCNLDCSWCDTPYTWDWTRFDQAAESSEMAVADVVEWVQTSGTDLVVITGGEPLAHRQGLLSLATELHARGRRVEVETNGTILPHENLLRVVTQFNVSPKLAGSGVAERRRIRPAVLQGLQDSGKGVFKFVIAKESDVVELIELQARYGLRPVWVMPEGTTASAVLTGLRALVAPALEYGWNITPRLHILLWGDDRGR